MQRGHIWPVVITAALLGGLEDRAEAGARRESVALTVYNQDLALVKDVRVLDLTPGNAEVRVDDVAAFIDPTSVHFTALDHPDAVAVLEQNYVYDLADADRLLNRYLDHSITVFLAEDGGRKTGTLLSQSGGDLVLQTEKGASIVSRGQVRDVMLGELPGGLVAKPALVWTLTSDRKGPERVELSYLTNNVTWHADYVAVVNANDDGLTLNGWVSLDNRSGASYENAKLKLVAGDVHRLRTKGRAEDYSQAMTLRSSSSELRHSFEERPFFEYHIYTLDRPATVADRETKQLALFPSAQVPVRKTYTFEGDTGALDDTKVAVQLEFKNREGDGLGIPLPKGKIRVYKADADGLIEFVGEDYIDHTPRDETVRLFLGNAFDIVGDKQQTDYKKLSVRTAETTYSIEFRNHKTQSVEVAAIERMHADWTIVEHSHKFVKKDAHTVEFLVEVPAHSNVTVVYTVRTKY